MTDSNREKMLARARKLFRLSNDVSSEHEAAIAMKRVSSMITEYGFTEAELAEEKNHQFSELTAGKTYKNTLPKHYLWLATATATLTDTVSVEVIRGNTRRIVFRGVGGDSEVATMTFDYLLGAMDRGLNQYKKETGLKGAAVIKSYRAGFSLRMNDRAGEIKYARMEQQINESATGRALVVIKADLIKNHFSKTTPRISRRATINDSNAYHAGSGAADHTSLNSQINGRASQHALT